jgi:heat-inducible transcriptional repressor
LKRLTELINVYLINQTSDKINMQIIARLEALMGRAQSAVHPTLKVIYEVMNEADSADVRIEGVNKLLKYPEYKDVTKLGDLLSVLEEKDRLLDVISTNVSTSDDINIYIGTENDSDVMQNTTMIFKNVNVGGKTLAVGVIGPRRMDYEKVIGMINSLARGIDRMYGQRGLLKDGYDND